jgi:hypothetical protein
MTVRVTQLGVEVGIGPPETRETRLAQTALETVVAAPLNDSNNGGVPRITQLALEIAILENPPQITQSLAWTFVLDGHQFYVLNLGSIGTYCYDTITSKWSNFSTQGYEPMWNMLYGNMWGTFGDRIMGGDALNPVIYEIDPSAILDEGWRDIYHEVSAFIDVRGRSVMRLDDLRLSGSLGFLDEVNGATINMIYSDDQGITWSDVHTVMMTEGSTMEIAWRSLGSFAAPGRIFLIYDSGGMIRIDGADFNTNMKPTAAASPPQQGQ